MLTDWGPTCTGSIDSLLRKSPKFKSTEATTTNITKYDSTEGPKSLFEILSREVGNTTRSRGFCSLQAQLPSCCVWEGQIHGLLCREAPGAPGRVASAF